MSITLGAKLNLNCGISEVSNATAAEGHATAARQRISACASRQGAPRRTVDSCRGAHINLSAHRHWC